MKPYRSGNQVSTRTLNVSVEVESIALSLTEDSDCMERPLVQLFVKNGNVTFKSCESEDDAGTFILKKLGIY
jgi:hypothetical protein